MRRVLTMVGAMASRVGAVGAVGALVLLGVAAAGSAPWWGPRILSHMSYFQLRHVELSGQRYLPPSEVLSLLDVDTTLSIWTDLDALEQRVTGHPEVRSVNIERRLPGTLVVRINENLPVALVPTARGLGAVDAEGELLPLDPSRVDVDLPVLQRPDSALLAILAEVRGERPALFERISTARRTGRDELELTLASYVVRVGSGVTAARLADIVPVEHDLARRGSRIAELDLRFRDQVIARLQ